MKKNDYKEYKEIDKMDRNALLIYLRDLRDLELAKRKIETVYSRELQNYRETLNSLSNTNFVQIPRKESDWSVGMVVWLIVSLFLTFMGIYAFVNVVKDGAPSFIIAIVIIFIIIFGGISISIISGAISDSKINKRKIDDVYNHNRLEQRRVEENKEKITKLECDWKRRKDFLKSEAKKVVSLLNYNYGLNIIPNEYRGLASIYYIYDYMSSSQETLSSTLLHEGIRAGIEKILQKLDLIIEQNERIIFNSHINESHNDIMIKQNEQMLRMLEQAEIDRRLAAQYAEILAYYNMTNSYFSLADYLKF